MRERDKMMFIRIAIPIIILLGAILIDKIMSNSIENLVTSPVKYGVLLKRI
ncbi:MULTISPECIES: hypothetical protein [Clostridium]|uniref:hypothetical protein n=1 Tax=Clostridium TaxID=1485 RepID=UPI000AFB4CA3|nr:MULTISPECIES: hypothetical protein [Clostridium]MCD2348161.1 hypothetical protein [Clostridium guangxiense]